MNANEDNQIKVPVERQQGVCLAVSILISDIYGVGDIMSRSRKKNIKDARQMIHYLLRENTDMPLAVIGQHVGDRDHATVLHSHRNVGDLLAVYPKLYESQVNELTELARAEINKAVYEADSDTIMLKDAIVSLRTEINGRPLLQSYLNIVEGIVKKKIVSYNLVLNI